MACRTQRVFVALMAYLRYRYSLSRQVPVFDGFRYALWTRY
jgi:hypothetical protein